MKISSVFLAMAVVIAGGGAEAASRDPGLDCNGFSGAADTIPATDTFSDFTLATIAVPRANFIANNFDKPGCPSANAACVRKGYLLAGNTVVLIGLTAPGGYTCAAYIDARGRETDGWLPAASVKPFKAPVNWIGKWKASTYAELDIVAKPRGMININGSATYGEGDAVHEGDIDADLGAGQDTAAFVIDGDKQLPYAKASADNCAVLMRQIGPYLAVADNINCGGANVTFSGLYSRR